MKQTGFLGEEAAEAGERGVGVGGQGVTVRVLEPSSDSGTSTSSGPAVAPVANWEAMF